MALTLEFVFDAKHSFTIAAPTNCRNALEIKEYLASTFEIPRQTIHLFENREYIEDRGNASGHREILDSTPVPQEPTKWFFSHLAEEPDNWQLKKSRCVSFLDCAIEQLTVDMNVSLFGLYKECDTTKVGPKEWQSVNEFELKGRKYAAIPLTDDNWKKAYADYYKEHGDFINSLYVQFKKKIMTLTTDMNTLLLNMEQLNYNDVELVANLKMRLVAPVSEHQLLSPVKGLKSVIEFSEKTTLSKTVEYNITTTTSKTVEYNVQSNYFELQKVSGMYLALKKERCRYETYLKQLRTHRRLFTIRGYLLKLKEKNVFNYEERSMNELRKVSQTIEHVNALTLKRKAVEVTQTCVAPCCEVEKANFYCERRESFQALLEAPANRQKIVGGRAGRTSFKNELLTSLFHAGKSEIAASWPSLSELPAYEEYDASVASTSGFWEIKKSKVVGVIFVPSKGLYVVDYGSGRMKLHAKAEQIPSDEDDLRILKFAITSLLTVWALSSAEEKMKAEDYTSDLY